MTEWIILRMGVVDLRLYRAMARSRRPLLTSLLTHLTRLGDPPVMVGLALCLLAGVPLPAPGAHASVLATAFALGLSQILKRSIQRPRPQLRVGLQSVIEAPDRFSFPSGHASATLAMALPIALALSPVAMTAILGTALLVGVSRCYLGVHYPGDVLAGWGIGVVSALAALVLT
jgi:undecaprenyl-diphosphatase